MARNPSGVVWVALALVLAVGCSSGYKRYECTVGPGALEPDPRAIWNCHRDIVDRAAHDRKFTLLEYRRATEFFERLTSIPAASVETEFGPVPTRELRECLARWDAWYERNHAGLVWDAERRSVVFSPDAG